MNRELTKMFIDIMTLILMILGLLIIIVSLFDYSKLISDLKNNLETIPKKHEKSQFLLNIASGILIFIIGLFVFIKLIHVQYAFIYFLVITIFGKIYRYVTKN